jgi:hypothetical protein
MKNKNILALAVLAVAGSPMALACDCCSVFSACNVNQDNEKGFIAGVASQYTHFGTLQMDSQEIPGHGEYIDSFVSQIFVGYNFNKRFSIELNVPIIARWYGSDTMHGTVSGLGDISVVGNFRPYQYSNGDFSFNWSILGGIKLPTGDSSLLNTPDSALPDGIGGHDLALGSGSVDGIIGTGFSIQWKRYFLSGNMQYAIRTEGDFQHQYANDWTWSVGPGAYVWIGQTWTVAAQVVTSGDSKGMDTFAGVPDEDSAETAVYLGPQVNVTWGSQLIMQMGADLPVTVENSGLQVVPDYRVHASVTWRF